MKATGDNRILWCSAAQAFTATDTSMNLYSNYMRGQIRQYLTNHLRMVPDAVVLVATLRPATPAPTPAAAAAAVTAANGASPTASAYVVMKPRAPCQTLELP